MFGKQTNGLAESLEDPRSSDQLVLAASSSDCNPCESCAEVAVTVRLSGSERPQIRLPLASQRAIGLCSLSLGPKSSNSWCKGQITEERPVTIVCGGCGAR